MTAMQSVCRKPTQLLRPLAQKIGNYLPSNVLGAPHMIQTKVPGDKLYHIYPTMIRGETLCRATCCTPAWTNVLDLHVIYRYSGRRCQCRWPLQRPPRPDDRGVHSSNGTNFLSFLTTRFNFYINYELSQNPRAQYVPSFMNAFLEPARDIVHSRIVLHHSNFHSWSPGEKERENIRSPRFLTGTIQWLFLL